MDRRKFLATGVVTTAAGVVVPQVVLAEPQKKRDPLASPLAGGIFYTEAHPGRWASKAGIHVPQVQSSGGMVLVTTRHVMDGYTHYIVKHVLLDAGMNVLGEHHFDPMKDKAPVSEFEVKTYKGLAFAVSMCNQHDVWVTEFTI